ncbi:MAG: hypothetical protein QOD07_1011 [Frankiaceae bacterium]|nr:hypothetical protein [Frankiaceae bacterium]
MTEPPPDPSRSDPSPVDPGPVRRSPDPLLLVLAGIAAGVGLIVDREVQTGLYACAATLLVAALLRLALRPRAAGNLVVRSRHVDVAVLLAAAAAIAVLAAVTPFPRSG